MKVLSISAANKAENFKSPSISDVREIKRLLDDIYADADRSGNSALKHSALATLAGHRVWRMYA